MKQTLEEAAKQGAEGKKWMLGGRWASVQGWCFAYASLPKSLY